MMNSRQLNLTCSKISASKLDVDNFDSNVDSNDLRKKLMNE